MSKKTNILHPIYLPFSESQLKCHFSKVGKSGKCIESSNKHIEYFKKSLKNYQECPKRKDRKGKSLSDMRKPCQVEKDERFWTASCLMNIYYSNDRVNELSQLFKKAFGNKPPFVNIKSWKSCFEGELHLFFETNLPSSMLYKKWLCENLTNNHLIPYIIDTGSGRKNLEGATNVDAILINIRNGFAVIIEAKVLSDISYDITYDTMRNQIARNIDVMLEKNSDLCAPLNQRDPDKTLFVLVTPQIFKQNPRTRLYGYKIIEYINNSNSLRHDLSHRTNIQWETISERLGWLTWEDFKDVNSDCCRWIDKRF